MSDIFSKNATIIFPFLTLYSMSDIFSKNATIRPRGWSGGGRVPCTQTKSTTVVKSIMARCDKYSQFYFFEKVRCYWFMYCALVSQ